MAAGALLRRQGRPARAAAARLVWWSLAGALAWVLSRRPDSSGDLRGFFKGIGLEGSSSAAASDSQVKFYKVDNSEAQSGSAGMAFRSSKNMAAVVQGEGVPWDGTVQGIDEGDGWVKVGDDRYLPMVQSGATVLQPIADDAQMDWKDAQFMRQMQRVQRMKDRMNPNRQKTEEELQAAVRRKAVWKAMSSRNTENTFDASYGADGGDGMQFEVKLQKPMGISLVMEPNGDGRVRVGDLTDGYPGKMCNRLQIGDVLIGVEDKDVRKMDVEEVTELILSLEGDVGLKFWRAD